LVGSAVEIWEEQGWAAVTMRGVCARSGLSDRYFYESFADRDALLGTVWDQMRDETLDMAVGAMSEVADRGALEQLRAVLHAVVHHIADEPNRAQIIFGDHSGSVVLEQRRRDTVQMSTDLMIGLARPFLRDGVDEQALRVNVLLGIGGFVELMLAWRDGLVHSTTDQVVDHLADVGAALGARFLGP
jgi:AcrR family transcriptional regulator